MLNIQFLSKSFHRREETYNMNNETNSKSLSSKRETTARKPWQTPTVETRTIEQTESDFIAVTDGTSFFS
jgi:hypothetical protein